MPTSAERVINSIQLLDKHHNEWRKLVHWDKLNLLNGRFCVLGQIYGDYHTGLNELELGDGDGEYAFTCQNREIDEMHLEWCKQAKVKLVLFDELLERKAVVMRKADEIYAQQQALEKQLTDLQKCINALSL